MHHQNGTLGNAPETSPKPALAHSRGSTLRATVFGESSEDHMSLGVPTNGTLRKHHDPSPKKNNKCSKNMPNSKFLFYLHYTLVHHPKTRCTGFL